MKYRLNIKYPIERILAKCFTGLYEYDGHMIDTVEDSDEIGFKYVFVRDKNNSLFKIPCPESWIEEIKNDAFEKWFDKNKYEVDIVEKTWKASEKNTHELYEPLIELIERYNDRSNGFMQEMFEKELANIKALTSNV